jgi:hypothetical protein
MPQKKPPKNGGDLHGFRTKLCLKQCIKQTNPEGRRLPLTFLQSLSRKIPQSLARENSCGALPEQSKALPKQIPEKQSFSGKRRSNGAGRGIPDARSAKG